MQLFNILKSVHQLYTSKDNIPLSNSDSTIRKNISDLMFKYKFDMNMRYVSNTSSLMHVFVYLYNTYLIH